MGAAIGTADVANVAAGYADAAQKSQQTQKTQQKNRVSGKTIGEPQLSEKGAKYYEQLKAKYGNYDFILVSKDQKANAERNAAQ